MPPWTLAHWRGGGAPRGIKPAAGGLSEGGLEGCEPETVVGELGVALFYGGLEAEDLSAEGEGLELPVGLDDRECRGSLVDLAALYAHEAVFDHVHPPDAVLAGDPVQLDDELDGRQLLAVEACREAFLESDLDVAGLVGGLLRGDGQLEDV